MSLVFIALVCNWLNNDQIIKLRRKIPVVSRSIKATGDILRPSFIAQDIFVTQKVDSIILARWVAPVDAQEKVLDNYGVALTDGNIVALVTHKNLKQQYTNQFAAMDASVASLNRTKESLTAMMDGWKSMMRGWRVDVSHSAARKSAIFR